MQPISRSFELRYLSKDPQANGETDFKGETSVLDTQQRIAYLNRYAELIPAFAEDFSLDAPAVTLEAAQARLAQIKPQPGPSRRRRIVLDDWRWIGDRTGGARKRIAPDAAHVAIDRQDWRCFLEWTVKETGLREKAFAVGRAAAFGFDREGVLYYVADHRQVRMPGVRPRTLKAELDFVYRRWNLLADGALVADFVAFSDPAADGADRFDMPPGAVANVWGMGYQPLTETPYEPFSIHLLVDEDFREDASLSGWLNDAYDDGGWRQGVLPIAHGGVRYAGEDLCLRRRVMVDEVPERAEWYIESIAPGGEVYVNGRLVALIKSASQVKIDVTDHLHAGENLLAVRVYADEVKERDKETHTHTDLHTGWYAARMHLDLLPPIYIDDVFTWTDSIAGDGLSAVQKIRAEVHACRGIPSALAAEHRLQARLAPWFPDEGAACAQARWRVWALPNLTETTEAALTVHHPGLWTCATPRLYKLTVELVNPDGIVVDDFVCTAGIRTVGQPGGVFCINNRPELLRAPLLFGARPPMDRIAAWEKCPPAEYYVQEMLMVKGMNGNGLRMSVHDRRIGGINDPRVCELADQLGLMLVWQSNTWLRITAATNINYDELALDIRQVRNHCSVVIWQPANHPSWKGWEGIVKVYRMMRENITALDPSRLISPAADSRRMRGRFDDGLRDHWGNPCEATDPAWTAPGICRGNMDYLLGYGAEWTSLREWPNVQEKHLPRWMESTAYIPSYLNSPERAYFNFEHDEIIGQPNWRVHQGKPSYHIHSYEHEYDAGSIGRELDFDEWRTSQAWQALGAYASVVKCRWLDYDGLSWCDLRGGQNTCTYMKALLDYYGQPKLAYYTHRLAFQDVLALSGNVDMVYGPKDAVPVIILNLGEEKTVRLQIDMQDQQGRVVSTKEYRGIRLPKGRTVTPVDSLKPDGSAPEGLYSFTYTVFADE